MTTNEIIDTIQLLSEKKGKTMKDFIEERLNKSLLSYEYDLSKLLEELSHKNTLTVLDKYNKGRYEKFCQRPVNNNESTAEDRA